MWTKKYSLATLLRCDILNKTNRPSCRVCKIYLDKNNTYASMLKRHNHICKECHKSEVEKRKNILSNNLASNSKENSIELGVKIKDRAIKMMREGKGLPEVSRILGIHENTVRSWKKREIEDRATSEFSKNTASKGASLDDIIGTWGVNKTSIEFEISKNNLKKIQGFLKKNNVFSEVVAEVQNDTFEIEKVFWQPGMNNKVVYLKANKSKNIQFESRKR